MDGGGSHEKGVKKNEYSGVLISSYSPSSSSALLINMHISTPETNIPPTGNNKQELKRLDQYYTPPEIRLQFELSGTITSKSKLSAFLHSNLY